MLRLEYGSIKRVGACVIQMNEFFATKAVAKAVDTGRVVGRKRLRSFVYRDLLEKAKEPDSIYSILD